MAAVRDTQLALVQPGAPARVPRLSSSLGRDVRVRTWRLVIELHTQPVFAGDGDECLNDRTHR